MDEQFGAYLDRARASRAELGDAMAALSDALGLPAEPPDLWRRRVRAALTELAHDVLDHVALTESAGGLHDDLRARAPRLLSGVDALSADHVHFLDEVERLLQDRDDGHAGDDPERHRADVDALLTGLTRHRKRGADLVYEAYAVDLGGSG